MLGLQKRNSLELKRGIGQCMTCTDNPAYIHISKRYTSSHNQVVATWLLDQLKRQLYWKSILSFTPVICILQCIEICSCSMFFNLFKELFIVIRSPGDACSRTHFRVMRKLSIKIRRIVGNDGHRRR